MGILKMIRQKRCKHHYVKHYDPKQKGLCGGVLFAGKWRNMGLSRTCKRCRCCPKREACDLKRMESLGYLDPSTLTFPVEIHVNVDTGADIAKISEDISKVLGKVVLHGD